MLEDYGQELIDLAEKRFDLACKYAKERKVYGECKGELDILLAGYILKLQEKKKNLGYEVALVMLMAELGIEVKELYRKYIEHYNNYKAIERMIDAVDAKITVRQSIMRYNRENDGGG